MPAPHVKEERIHWLHPADGTALDGDVESYELPRGPVRTFPVRAGDPQDDNLATFVRVQPRQHRVARVEIQARELVEVIPAPLDPRIGYVVVGDRHSPVVAEDAVRCNALDISKT